MLATVDSVPPLRSHESVTTTPMVVGNVVSEGKNPESVVVLSIEIGPSPIHIREKGEELPFAGCETSSPSKVAYYI